MAERGGRTSGTVRGWVVTNFVRTARWWGTALSKVYHPRRRLLHAVSVSRTPGDRGSPLDARGGLDEACQWKVQRMSSDVEFEGMPWIGRGREDDAPKQRGESERRVSGGKSVETESAGESESGRYGERPAIGTEFEQARLHGEYIGRSESAIEPQRMPARRQE